MFSKICSVNGRWPPESLAGLLEEKEWILKDAFVAQFKVNAVFGHLDVGHPPQGIKQMLFRLRVIDRPDGLRDTA